MRTKPMRLMPILLAATLGLGLGFGAAEPVRADAACRQQCAAEFQECLASTENGYPGFHRCRQWFSACVNTCD